MFYFNNLNYNKGGDVEMFKKCLSFFVFAFVAICAYAGDVFAAGTGTVDLQGVSVDTASVLELAAIILVAIGAIWGIKKLIKLANRS